MAKTTKKKKVIEPQKIELNIEKQLDYYVPCEWVVQFDNDPPQVFASSDENSESHEVVIKLPNTNESHIKFVCGTTGKSFRMFARPKTV